MRQVALSGRLQRLQTTLHEAPANASASACHGIAVRELSRHRLVVPEHGPLCKTTKACTTDQSLPTRPVARGRPHLAT